MQKPYGEGLASHTGPKSCAGSREAGREALTGAHAGGVLSREMPGNQVPTLFIRGEGNTGGRAIASTRWTCEV
jgi:RNA-directed DNA polymerase